MLSMQYEIPKVLETNLDVLDKRGFVLPKYTMNFWTICWIASTPGMTNLHHDLCMAFQVTASVGRTNTVFAKLLYQRFIQ